MCDSIRVLLKFINQADSAVLFVNVSFFSETIEINDFRDELEDILHKENVNFKIKRITFIDNEFGEEVDLPKVKFIFENKQVFKVFCEVSSFLLFFFTLLE